MAENKTYFWFKLKEDFFHSKEIKIIRRLPSGAEMLIVLFKLQLSSLKTGGIIEIDGIFNTIEEELSVLIDENQDLIKLSLVTFYRYSLITSVNKSDVKMLLHDELVGKETASTLRSRKSRANNQKLLQCNNDATLLQHQCNTEIDIELKKEQEGEKKKEINKELQQQNKENPDTKKNKEPHRQGLNKYTGRKKEDYYLSDEELETKLNELLKLNPKEVENTDYEVIKYFVNKKLEDRKNKSVKNDELEIVLRWVKTWGLVKVNDILKEANLKNFQRIITLDESLDFQGNIQNNRQSTNSDRPFTGVREVESTPLKMKSKSKIDTDDQQIQGASGW
jgi:predicted phage replisome organizer